MDVATKAEQIDRLGKDALARMNDATACTANALYFAACAMAGASVESGLLAQVLLYETDLRAAGHLSEGDYPLIRLKMDRLIHVAVKVGWLPTTLPRLPNERIVEALDGEIGDAVRFLQYVRNLVCHPGKRVDEVPWLEVGESEAELMVGIAGTVFEHLDAALERLNGTEAPTQAEEIAESDTHGCEDSAA